MKEDQELLAVSGGFEELVPKDIHLAIKACVYRSDCFAHLLEDLAEHLKRGYMLSPPAEAGWSMLPSLFWCSELLHMLCHQHLFV